MSVNIENKTKQAHLDQELKLLQDYLKEQFCKVEQEFCSINNKLDNIEKELDNLEKKFLKKHDTILEKIENDELLKSFIKDFNKKTNEHLSNIEDKLDKIAHR